MKIIKSIFKEINKAKNWFLRSSIPAKIAVFAIILGLGWLVYSRIQAAQTNQTQYQTATAEKGTLITSISGSGSITSSNYTNVTTKVSGVIKKVSVTNGDTVTKGQTIAEVELDDYAKERQTTAWVSYLEATEAVKDAEKAKMTADIQMWKDRETLLDAITDFNNNKGDSEGDKMIVRKTVDEARLAFSASELKYINTNSDIANTKAKVSAALRNYQENSEKIVAPASGKISDLALAKESLVSASSITSSISGATIVSAQTVAKISDPNRQLVATVNLTEIDIVNVKANQKVTLNLDAYSDKTFTGKVLAINTSGSVSSDVTSYPVTILLNQTSVEIYPNMAVSVNIITNIKNDVILVPSSAIQTINNQSTVQIIKNKEITSVQVEVGSSNDSQTEIVSGINAGDEVITSIISSQTSSQETTSPFSGIGRSSSIRSTRSSGVNIPIGGPPGGF